MTRFRVRADAVSGEHVRFDAEEAHHLVRVLRLGAGDVVQALDGAGHELTVRLTRVAGRTAEGTIVERVERRVESPLDLTLAQGIPKGDKLERIIRMATELGVSRVVPLITERTIARGDPSHWIHRLDRCRRVAREAATQSGRAVIPEVEPPRGLGEWLADPQPSGLLLCFWEGEEAGLATVLCPRGVDRATVIIGPEGGFSEAEVARLRSAGAVVAGLGPRILRVETAGPVALALLQARCGDLDSAR